MVDLAELKSRLQKVMVGAGIHPPEQLLLDGKLHRFSTNGSAGDTAGWYVAHAAPPAATFGDFRTGAEHKWYGGGDTLTAAEREQQHQLLAKAKQQRDAQERKQHDTARKEVARVWAACKPAPAKHPYLVAKGVKPHGIRIDAKGQLVVPLRDAAGVLHSVEYISGTATEGGGWAKRYHKGGRKTGAFYKVGSGGDKICIAEGLATAFSIHEATGYTVVAACDAGNLRPVADALRAKYRDATLIFCADDDYLNDINVGIDKARSAALAVGGLLAVPDFGDVERDGESDFNDLVGLRGELTVRGCIENATVVVAPAATDWEYPAAITWEEWNTARTTPTCIVDQYLYADIGVLAAPGGTGKTTYLLYEAIHIVLGLPLFGQLEVRKPGPVVILTAEDGREVLVGRLREVAHGMRLTKAQLEIVHRDVRISDLCGSGLRLTRVEADMVVPHPVVDRLISEILRSPTLPVLVLIDPTISFGVGESRVNDAEQGLIEAARRIRRALGDCCVRYVHHTGKQNARQRVTDQYAARGGSALPDGVRMNAVMQPIDATDWKQRTGDVLLDGENAIEIARPKVSYAPPNLPSILLKRIGWSYFPVREVKLSKTEVGDQTMRTVFETIRLEDIAQHYPTQNSLQDMDLGLTQKQTRLAVHRLLTEGWVEVAPAPTKAHQYLKPTAKGVNAAEAKNAPTTAKI